MLLTKSKINRTGYKFSLKTGSQISYSFSSSSISQNLKVPIDLGKTYHFAPVKYALKAQGNSFLICQPGRRHVKLFLVPDPTNKVPEPALLSDVIIAGWNRHGQDISNLHQEGKKKLNQ